jgi:hypothetical protein
MSLGSTVASPSDREYHRGVDGIDGKYKISLIREHAMFASKTKGEDS